MKNGTDSDIAENDALRSSFMWGLITKTNFESRNPCTKKKIPPQIIQFWDSEFIPPDVMDCIKSWKQLEKRGFSRLLFNDATARIFIQKNFDNYHLDAFENCHHPAMRADYFRLCYLCISGGIYVDADDIYNGVDISALFTDDRLKIQSLCYDLLSDSMVKTTDFIYNNKHSDNLIYYVNNDPIIAPPNHPLLRLALERATNILLSLTEPRPDIQSTTGPGNLTASLVHHALKLQARCEPYDFIILNNWDDIAVPAWPLEYRKDKRNWRLWDGSEL